MGSLKFKTAEAFTKSVLCAQQVSGSESRKLLSALSQVAFGSSSIDGEYSFAKLVLRELISPTELEICDARAVYGELDSMGDISLLPTLPRLLANRAFDLLVQKSVVSKLDSSAKIVVEIQSQAENFSVGDWLKIAMAMKPKILWTIIVSAAALVGGAFGLGWKMNGTSPQTNQPRRDAGQLLSPTASTTAQPQPKAIGTEQ